jgi:O-antigen ligase
MNTLTLAIFASLPTIGLLNGPIYAPLLFGLAILQLVLRRGKITPDRTLMALAAGFALLCWLSCLWSIVPGHSVAGAAQMTAVLAGALLVSAMPKPPKLAATTACAVIAGSTLMVADRLTGNYLLHLVSSHEGATKYNRGIDYLSILLMPLIGTLVVQRHRILAAATTLAAIACVAEGKSTTAWIALPAAALVLALAARAPRLTARLITAAVAAGALALPFALRILSGIRPSLAPYIKESMLRRLEIWDYVSARIMERPLFGWGIWTSKSLPITSDELSHYVREHGEGIYPHNQWLELWVETGAAGLLLALAFALIVLWRVPRLPPAMQPFGYAAFSLALMVSLTSFEITTDSWWAALAACALLLAVKKDLLF